MSQSPRPQVHGIFDPATWTVTYVVHDGPGTACAIVDSVLDYDPKSGRTRTASADKVIEYVQANRLRVEWILETHAHADHLTAAPYLKRKLGGRTGIGEHIATVQKVFKGIFNLEPAFRQDGSQFDHLFRDGEEFRIGELTATCHARTRPHAGGHGLPDRRRGVRRRHDVHAGRGHCALRLPRRERAHALCLGAQDPRAAARRRGSSCATTIRRTGGRWPSRPPWPNSAQKNIHIHDGVSEEEFVAMRTKRDATLEMPVLILPSVQVNMRAGEMPPKEDNGVSYLKIPINAL